MLWICRESEKMYKRHCSAWKKQNTPVAYDLNKCLFYILREMKKRGTISHAKVLEVSGMLDNVLKAEDVK